MTLDSVPGVSALSAALRQAWLRSGRQGSVSVDVVGLRAVVAELEALPSGTPLCVAAGKLMIAMRDTRLPPGVPAAQAALACVSTLLSSNRHGLMASVDDNEALAELDVLLVWVEAGDSSMEAELSSWVEARLVELGSDASWGLAVPQGRAVDDVRGFIVSPITGCDDRRMRELDAEVEGVARALADMGIAAPQARAGASLDRSPVEIDRGDLHLLSHCDLLVLIADAPSTGLGLIAGYAHRHHPIVFVLAPLAGPIPPLLSGMTLPYTLIRAATPGERLQQMIRAVSDRRNQLDVRVEFRAARRRAWTPVWNRVRRQTERVGGVNQLHLPDWLSRRRVEQILVDAESFAGASVLELSALQEVLALEWRQLQPGVEGAGEALVSLTAEELQSAMSAASAGDWSVATVDRAMNHALWIRRREGQIRASGRRVRQRLDLLSVEAWLGIEERTRGTR